MTIKERIEAFVKQQGNQVGAGAELAAILNDIVDSIPGEYTLPPASAQTLGGIKVGENLSITEQGVLSASGAPKEEVVFDLTGYPTSNNMVILPSDVYNPIAEALETKQVFVKIYNETSIFKSMIVAFRDNNGNIDYPLTCFTSSSVISIMLD